MSESPSERGTHVKLPRDRLNFSVRSRVFPDCRSCTSSRHLSASKPARACERQARYFPSGEYSGVVSAPGLVEIFFGVPPLIATPKISLFVLVASTSSILLVYATSWPSGEIAYMSWPPRLNGGTSWSPGVRSRGCSTGILPVGPPDILSGLCDSAGETPACPTDVTSVLRSA